MYLAASLTGRAASWRPKVAAGRESQRFGPVFGHCSVGVVTPPARWASTLGVGHRNTETLCVDSSDMSGRAVRNQLGFDESAWGRGPASTS